MSYIYQAALWCSDCAEKIKDEAFEACPRHNEFESREAWEEFLGYDNESYYDSDEYPKGPSCSDESDCPEHCDGCHVFLENDLTSEGVEYVRCAVNDDRAAGRFDSVACTEWAEYYNWIDFDNWCHCVECGDFALCDEYDTCETCNDWE